jgi:hypothetical protein
LRDIADAVPGWLKPTGYEIPLFDDGTYRDRTFARARPSTTCVYPTSVLIRTRSV